MDKHYIAEALRVFAREDRNDRAWINTPSVQVCMEMAANEIDRLYRENCEWRAKAKLQSSSENPSVKD